MELVSSRDQNAGDSLPKLEARMRVERHHPCWIIAATARTI